MLTEPEERFESNTRERMQQWNVPAVRAARARAGARSYVDISIDGSEVRTWSIHLHLVHQHRCSRRSRRRSSTHASRMTSGKLLRASCTLQELWLPSASVIHGEPGEPSSLRSRKSSISLSLGLPTRSFIFEAIAVLFRDRTVSWAVGRQLASYIVPIGVGILMLAT